MATNTLKADENRRTIQTLSHNTDMGSGGRNIKTTEPENGGQNIKQRLHQPMMKCEKEPGRGTAEESEVGGQIPKISGVPATLKLQKNSKKIQNPKNINLITRYLTPSDKKSELNPASGVGQRKTKQVPNQTYNNNQAGRVVSVKGEVISDLNTFLVRKRLEREQKGGERNCESSCRKVRNLNLNTNPAEHKPNRPVSSLPEEPTGVETKFKTNKLAGATEGGENITLLGKQEKENMI